MLSHNLIGVIAIVIGFIGYAPYLYDMFKGRTKPHIFSWTIWVLLEFTSFGIQIKNGAGAGSWVTLFSASVALIIVIYAFKYKNLMVTRIDWICFVGAVISLILWLLFNQPLIASIFLVITDLLAFIPTFRKTWNSPHDETLFEYAMASLKFIVAFFAFNSFSTPTVIYPAYLIIANTTFVIFALVRRKMIKTLKIQNKTIF